MGPREERLPQPHAEAARPETGHPRAPDTPLKPELFASGCDKPLPVWGVTRQFDFAQFVILYKEETVDGRPVSLPLVVAPDATVSDTSQRANVGRTQIARTNGRGAAGTGSGRPPTDGRPPDGSLAASIGGIPLDLALTTAGTIELMTRPPATVALGDLGPVLADGSVEHEGRELFPLLDDNSRGALAAGEAVTVLAETRPAEGSRAASERLTLTLVPNRLELTLDDAAIDTALVSGEVALPGEGRLQLDRDERVDDLLYNARPVRTTARLESGAVKAVRLMPGAPESMRPAAAKFMLEDPALFVADPVVPALDTSALRLALNAEVVGLLRKTGRARIDVNGFELQLEVAAPTVVSLLPRRDGEGGVVLPWPELEPRTTPEEQLPLGPQWKGWRRAYEAPPTGDDKFLTTAEPAAGIRPKGLPVAVFLPWRQRWKLDGFTRGNLLSSIALAPHESRAVRVSSWERRAKALEQSTETETQLESDFTSTTRDTEDVFREMTNNQEFQAQAHGEVDASYSTGTASIAVNVGGSLGQSTNLEQIARSSTTHMQETTRRSSARVRSRRVTKISESQESFQGEDVVRQITNGNGCHTLTLDYYEKLAHYTVTTQFVPERVKVVVLIDNPLGDTRFNSLTVRTNETALKQSLINPELTDAFAASRLLASYTHAWKEAEYVATRSKEVAELDRERVKQPDSPSGPAPAKPDNPHAAKLRAVLTELRTAAGPVLSANFKAAIDEIADHKRPVEVANRQSAQRWLWRRLVEAKIGPALVNKLQALTAKSGVLTPDDARTLSDAIPKNSYPLLKDLGSLKDTEKEDAALSAAIRSRMVMEWDWAWWSGSCREEGLYNPDDNGIAGACDRLVSVLRDYDAKEAEGDALLSQQELVNKANEDQAAANWVDKLEFKYGLDVVADAREREEALLAHLDANSDYYRYVLFQALPPSEQQARLLASAPQLKVGFFEPRVVAYYGKQLAVPVSPTGKTELATLIGDIGEKLKKASDEAVEASKQMDDDGIILPTPGLMIETSLGSCSGCGPHEQSMLDIAARRADAEAKLLESEARRRTMRLDKKDLSDFGPCSPPLSVDVTVDKDNRPKSAGSPNSPGSPDKPDTPGKPK